MRAGGTRQVTPRGSGHDASLRVINVLDGAPVDPFSHRGMSVCGRVSVPGGIRFHISGIDNGRAVLTREGHGIPDSIEKDRLSSTTQGRCPLTFGISVFWSTRSVCTPGSAVLGAERGPSDSRDSLTELEASNAPSLLGRLPYGVVKVSERCPLLGGRGGGAVGGGSGGGLEVLSVPEVCVSPAVAAPVATVASGAGAGPGAGGAGGGPSGSTMGSSCWASSGAWVFAQLVGRRW